MLLFLPDAQQKEGGGQKCAIALILDSRTTYLRQVAVQLQDQLIESPNIASIRVPNFMLGQTRKATTTFSDRGQMGEALLEIYELESLYEY